MQLHARRPFFISNYLLLSRDTLHDMHKQVVILYGAPGSGKGTQANLLAAKYGLIHFDAGRFLEGIVHDSSRQKDVIIRRERHLFDTGKLMTPRFVLKEVIHQIKRMAHAELGFVSSGSPRTLYEAEGLLPLLEKWYGKKNIHVVVLEVPSAMSLKRNSVRRLCSVCRFPVLVEYYPGKNPASCPLCGGKLYQRTLDKDKKIIKVRLEEYMKRTSPIFRLMKKRGYALHHLKGSGKPYQVFTAIERIIANDRA